MKYPSRRFIFVAVFAMLALSAALYLGPSIRAAAAMPGCSMGGDMRMGSNGACDMSGTATAGGCSIAGAVLGTNRQKGTISLRLDLPVQGPALNVLSQVRNGDQVTVTITKGKDGRQVISAIASATGGQTATLKISGIQCQACADRVESSLRAVPGVKDASISGTPPSATIVYDPAKTNVEALKAAVRNTEPIHPGTPFGAEE